MPKVVKPKQEFLEGEPIPVGLTIACAHCKAVLETIEEDQKTVHLKNIEEGQRGYFLAWQMTCSECQRVVTISTKDARHQGKTP